MGIRNKTFLNYTFGNNVFHLQIGIRNKTVLIYQFENNMFHLQLRTRNDDFFLFYTTVNLLLLPFKQLFLAVVVNRKTKTIKVDTRGTLLLKYGNSQRDLKSVRATTWRKIQKALKWNGSHLQNLVNFIALKGRKK